MRLLVYLFRPLAVGAVLEAYSGVLDELAYLRQVAVRCGERVGRRLGIFLMVLLPWLATSLVGVWIRGCRSARHVDGGAS